MCKLQIKYRASFLTLLFLGTVSWAGTQLPPGFREDALKNANESVKDSAVSPVPMELDSQPGYIRSTSRGNLANPYWENYSTVQLEETRGQFGVSSMWLTSKAQPVSDFGLSLRYRLSPAAW